MPSLLLTNDLWDLCLDASGNIALCDVPYTLAQEVANAIRTFLGEVYYDTTVGVPYNTKILNLTPPLAVFKDYMARAALSVPGVVSATCTIISAQNRNVTATVNFTDTSGTPHTVTI